jgi:hypothetical protein
MRTILTAKLTLQTTQEQFQALRRAQLGYRDALNVVSRYAFEHGKTSSNLALHRGMYAQLRARFGLPSQLAYLRFTLANVSERKRIILHGYGNACSRKALAERNGA